MGSFSMSDKPHAVCIPLPFQGHMNVMFKLAKLLHSRGFYITFVNTEFHHQKLLRARGPDSMKGLPDFQFETIPDGLPPCDIDSTQDMVALAESVKVNILAPFRNLITKLNEISLVEDSAPPVTCIVTDGVMTSPLIAAEELRLPGILLWPMSAAFLMSNLYCGELVEKGLIPPKDSSDLETPIDFIPGLRDIRVKDLPRYFLTMDKPRENYVADQLERASKASAIIINTFDALENEVLEALKTRLPPIYAMGPLQLLPQDTSNNQLNSMGLNLWKEDAECLKWLDSKQSYSVVYVNFGSLVVLTSQQLIELAWGLANSKYPFLWVIRPGLVTGDAAVLPPEFAEETADRGFISGRCPQEQVLKHSSIGGFLTHSEWNSSMDTICAGVPVISLPNLADQQMNCRCACAHWGIGMEINNDIKRDEVEALARELMEGEKGRKMSKTAMEWKKAAEESTKPGGSSYLSFDKILKKVLLQ